MIDLLAELPRLDHVLLRREALELGVDDKRLARMVGAGDLVRLRHGIYADARVWGKADSRTRHLLLATGVRRLYGDTVALSHVSAALAYGAPDWQLGYDSVHVTHLNGFAGRRQARTVHHRGGCYVDDLTVDEHGWITTPARTFVDVAKSLPTAVALVVADWILHKGLATKDQLWDALDRQGEAPYTLRIRAVIAHADPLAESVGETRSRYEFRAAGLPDPVPQLEIRDARGRFLARVDFAWPELKVIVEFDGRVKYDDMLKPGQTILDVIRAEKRRDRDLAALGWTVIRIEWDDLATPGPVMQRIRQALSRRAA